MERKYLIYRITSPSGKMYIGLTGQTLRERWLAHIKHGKRRKFNHPLYNAIKKYGHENFLCEVIEKSLTKEEAQEREKHHIALIPKGFRYNISDGGETDCETGRRVFWESIRADPEKRKEYIAKLSKSKLDNNQTDYVELQKLAMKWRKDNPRLAWKASHRAIRIASKNRPQKQPDIRPLKERLMWKHNRAGMTKKNATELWARRTADEKAVVGSLISKGQKEHLSTKSVKELSDLTSKARASINRSIQGPAASKGIKAFWVELRKDPVKYKEYIEARKATLKITNELKKNANIRSNQCWSQ